MSLFPFVTFDSIPIGQANQLLEEWSHKMGPCTRPTAYGAWAHALMHNGTPVALATTHALVRENVGGQPIDDAGLPLKVKSLGFTRADTVELSRLCAARPNLCRVALRLWREFVFPTLGYKRAISYQDADLHNGATYRFAGWRRVAYARAGGDDLRTGRKGRNRYVWVWP